MENETVKEIVYPPEFERILEYVKSIQFGQVIIQIQNGKIIQLDKLEKYRFDKHPE